MCHINQSNPFWNCSEESYSNCKFSSSSISYKLILNILNWLKVYELITKQIKDLGTVLTDL
ncbi:hypothetical protein pb186bvf_020851 [Paramecium bursaria]